MMNRQYGYSRRPQQTPRTPITREKSCGAVVYRRTDNGYEIVLIRHRLGGHWSFPKGHMEPGEDEFRTATREIQEEVGVFVRIDKNFRECVEYSPKRYVIKQVVYFLAQALDNELIPQPNEVAEAEWVPIEKAYSMLTYTNDRQIVMRAKRRLLGSSARREQRRYGEAATGSDTNIKKPHSRHSSSRRKR